MAGDSPLALAMTLRHSGADLPLEPGALAHALPEAGAKVAIFVHGLGETDASWRLRADARQPGYGACLRRDLGHAPIELRYNTGLHISDNGRALAALLEELHASWPVPIEEIVIIGHSMGGLVARSACHYASVEGHAWTSAVRHVFCLGSPHLGAPLEKGVNALGWALGRVPETRPLANLLGVRSAGIKDLRYGACVEEDWCDCDPDELLTDRCHDVPLLPGARFYFVAATLTRRPGDPVGAIFGDLLVRVPSAAGEGRRRKIGFAIEDGHRLGGLTHFDLLNHPAVYGQIRAWIER
jgi:pimeloyl-ACP methyl ester carboxylesterase